MVAPARLTIRDQLPAKNTPIAELLGVSTRERVSLRQEAREEAERPSSPGPWSKPQT